MLEGLNNMFWFIIAQRCSLTVEDAKIQIPQLANKYLNQTITSKDISLQIKESIVFYLKNKRFFDEE